MAMSGLLLVVQRAASARIKPLLLALAALVVHQRSPVALRVALTHLAATTTTLHYGVAQVSLTVHLRHLELQHMAKGAYLPAQALLRHLAHEPIASVGVTMAPPVGTIAAAFPEGAAKTLHSVAATTAQAQPTRVPSASRPRSNICKIPKRLSRVASFFHQACPASRRRRCVN